MWWFLGRETGSEPSFYGRFKSFAFSASVLDLAVYDMFYSMASALSGHIILPFLKFFCAGIDFSRIVIVVKEPVLGSNGAVVAGGIELNVGLFIQSVLDFLFVAFIIFLMVQLYHAISHLKDIRSSKIIPARPSRSDKYSPAGEPQALRPVKKITDKSQEELLLEIRDLLREIKSQKQASLK